MLFNLDNDKRIDRIPYAGDYRRLREALDVYDPRAYDRIHATLSDLFQGSEIETSSWIPGSNWSRTPYQAIYEACDRNPDSAAKFFGLLVWQVVMDLDTCWSSGRYELNGSAIRGRTYFQINRPK